MGLKLDVGLGLDNGGGVKISEFDCGEGKEKQREGHE